MVRCKRRYVVIEAKYGATPPSLTDKVIKQNILKGVTKIHGEFGAASISNGLQIKYQNGTTGIIFVRVNRGSENIIVEVLPHIKEFNGQKVSLSTLCTASTIRHAYLFVKNRNEKKAGMNERKRKLKFGEKVSSRRKKRVN